MFEVKPRLRRIYFIKLHTLANICSGPAQACPVLNRIVARAPPSGMGRGKLRRRISWGALPLVQFRATMQSRCTIGGIITKRASNEKVTMPRILSRASDFPSAITVPECRRAVSECSSQITYIGFCSTSAHEYAPASHRKRKQPALLHVHSNIIISAAPFTRPEPLTLSLPVSRPLLEILACATKV